MVVLAILVLSCLILPANIHAARAGVTLHGEPATGLRLRIPMQILFIAIVFWSAR